MIAADYVATRPKNFQQPEWRAFIDGEYREAASGLIYRKPDVALEGEELFFADCDELDVDDAVAAARRTYRERTWRGMPLRERKRILSRLADAILANAQELAELEARDMGKPVRNALAVDIPSAAECIAWYAEAIDKLYGEVAPVDPPGTAIVVREPLGVVAAVVPWNFPLLMTAWKIAPALAAGNSVVLKPSERSPLSAIRLAGLARDAGLPAGALNVVPGPGDRVGKALGLHMDVDCILFTGSTAVGKKFLAYSAESNLKQVWPECGGKSAQIAFADCDLDKAARGIANGIFFNQGQICNAGARLIVHESIREPLLLRLVAQAERLSPGNPLDPDTRYGALVDAPHCDSVLSAIDGAAIAGAKVLTGGIRLRVDGAGNFVAPTVLDGVTGEMDVWRHEVFGPVLAVTTFQHEVEAVELANDSDYGIAAGIWTSDLVRGDRVAAALRAGTVWINTYDRHSIATPFGGFGQSGFGRDRSLHAFEKVTAPKTIWSQRG